MGRARGAHSRQDALDPAPFVGSASAAGGAGRTGGAGRARVALRSREPGQPLKASEALWPCGTRRPRGTAQALGSRRDLGRPAGLAGPGPGDATRSREGQDDVSLAPPAALARLDDPEPAVKIPLPVDADARMENSRHSARWPALRIRAASPPPGRLPMGRVPPRTDGRSSLIVSSLLDRTDCGSAGGEEQASYRADRRQGSLTERPEKPRRRRQSEASDGPGDAHSR